MVADAIAMSGVPGFDPRAKLAVAVLWSFAVAAASGERALLAVPFGILLVVGARLERHVLWRVVKGTLLLWGLSFLANAFLIGGERVGPEILDWARPTREGLRAGAAQGGRLAVLAAISTWLVATTGALELAASLEWSVRRRPGWRRRAHRALLPLVLALRAVPLFLEEAARLRAVDRLRGGGGMGRDRVRRVAALLPVWVVGVVERADALGLALTLRGYDPDRERSFSRGYRFRSRDWLLLGGGLTGVVLLAW
jgi:energy-coupling factor transport system permease protein